MNKLSKILVLEGGKNEEHKVSLNTASEVKKILRKKEIIYKSLVVDPNNFEKKISKFSNKLIIFNALHGTYGEDGKIQKILKKINLNLHIQVFFHLKYVSIKSDQKKN